jgi:flagellar biosynthesis protein FlhA
MASTMAQRIDTGLKTVGVLKSRYLDIALPALFFAVLIVLFVPVPTHIMDVLLITNITLSALIMITVMYVKEPLQFSVFPSVLLGTTVFRLVLNIATTRLILSNAGTMKMEAAGTVIKTFAEFVASGSVAIGFIIFVIIMIVQFIVITKGATRIAEVGARFALDAMPGKQMAIDADLNAGLITNEQALLRRELIAKEADFYGAMDGASKFVRGDAIAAILITLVNAVGGLIVGVFMYGMSWTDALNIFTKLTIGDGLVTQIPALIVSTSAALIVARSSQQSSLGKEFFGQIFSFPRAFMIAGAFLLVLNLTPLPKIPLILMSLSCFGIGYLMSRSANISAEEKERTKRKEEAHQPERVENLLHVDPMELEVGYGLISMVDAAQGGDLLERVTMIRRQMATNLGFIVPPIRIRDNMQLAPTDYVVKIRGVHVAKGAARPEEFLAMDSGMATGELDGLKTREPAFNLPAYWITAEQKPKAETLGYTVVDATTVVVTHLTEIIKKNSADLLTREEVRRLVDAAREKSPSLIEEIIPKVVSYGELQKVLQKLLSEQVSVRDLEAVIEVMGDYAPKTRDADILAEYARNALAASICQSVRADDGKLYVATLDPGIEELVLGAVQHTDRGSFLALAPESAELVVRSIAEAVEHQVAAGRSPLVLTSPQIRHHIRRLIEKTIPGVAVLSYNEVSRETNIESVAMAKLAR